MAEPFDPALYAPLAAAAIGLSLPPEDVVDLVGALAVLAHVAGAVMAFPLPEDVVAAAIFTPGDEGGP